MKDLRDRAIGAGLIDNDGNHTWFPTGPYNVHGTFTVQVTVNDPNVVERCVNNEDGWRDDYYELDTYDRVLSHLTYNFLVNGVDRINRLEGWADCDDDAVKFKLEWIDIV